MAKKLTPTEKLRRAPAAHVTVLEKPYAGAPVGARLLIPDPALIAAALRQCPPGGVSDLPTLRQQWATTAGADVTCPLVTGIHLRMLAEVAHGELAAGQPAAAVVPVWRGIAPNSPLAQKLPEAGAWLVVQRQAEAATA